MYLHHSVNYQLISIPISHTNTLKVWCVWYFYELVWWCFG